MKVYEIFDSIEGEGKRSGELTTFIRLAGCNLNCSYCDTKYAQSEDSFNNEYCVNDILSQINYMNVTITGGEPLIHLGIDSLLQALLNRGFNVNIETNGSVDISQFKRKKITGIANMPFFTMDFKCYSSGMTDQMCLNNLHILDQNDVLKFVVQDERDLEQVFLLSWVNAQKYISPVFGKIEPKQIVEFMKRNKDVMCDYKLQLQLHKIIWSPEEKGV
jgi:7-carboxy-7-deazaguanine synthase